MKHRINLLQKELFPDKKLLTLSRVFLLWCLVLVFMVSWAVITDYQHQKIRKQHHALKKEKQRNSALVDKLEKQLANRKVDAVLSDKLETIKLLLQQKHALHTKLTDTNLTFVSGFAIAMDELSGMHHKDIYLQSVNIKNDDMQFSGLAKTPEAVPAWLDGFQQSTLLSGKSFVGFKLAKNDDNVTEFMVSSKANKGADK